MVSPLSFLKEVRTEIGNVSWPTKKETFRLTKVVIIISMTVGIFIGTLDFIFTNLMTFIFK